jgi:hypothetical protein
MVFAVSPDSLCVLCALARALGSLAATRTTKRGFLAKAPKLAKDRNRSLPMLLRGAAISEY